MEILENMKKRIDALYQKAAKEKNEVAFEEAMDLEFQYELTVLYQKESFPTK